MPYLLEAPYRERPKPRRNLMRTNEEANETSRRMNAQLTWATLSNAMRRGIETAHPKPARPKSGFVWDYCPGHDVTGGMEYCTGEEAPCDWARDAYRADRVVDQTRLFITVRDAGHRTILSLRRRGLVAWHREGGEPADMVALTDAGRAVFEVAARAAAVAVSPATSTPRETAALLKARGARYGLTGPMLVAAYRALIAEAVVTDDQATRLQEINDVL